MKSLETLLDLSTYVEVAATALIFVTLWSSGRRAIRRRDFRTLDIFLLALTFAANQSLLAPMLARFHRPLPALIALAAPFLFLRLTSYFRTPPKTVMTAALIAFVTVSVLYAAGAAPTFSWQWSLRTAYINLCAIYAAWLFASEVRRSAGVTRRRLAFATTSAVLAVVAYSISLADHLGFVTFGQKYELINAVADLSSIALFFAFATPQFLTRRWQRQEVTRYLIDTSNREAEDRGVHAPDDLMRAAKRGAAGSAVFVAIREDVTSETLVVRAASDPHLVGRILREPDGPLHLTFTQGDRAMFPTPDVDAAIRDALSADGETVLVAPIFTAVRRWGIVGVVQRRGSLFPGDDVRLLAQVAVYAGGILDHGHLVTEARERERRASDRRLRETESRMALMLDNITDHAILIVDTHGHIVNWPVGASAVFGYEEADVVDRSAGRLYDMSESDFVRILEDVLASGAMTREDHCIRRDGSRFFANTHIRPIDPGPDALQGFVIVTRDITERRELEERLRQGQKMEALGRLAGGIAHDFNNLLTAILGYADWLEQELPVADTNRRQQVGEIQKAAERAAGLTRQLLAFSRQQVVQPTVLDVTASLRDLLPMLRRVIGEHIDIVEEASGTVPPVLADRNQLEQVVINLAVNARDAMPGGGKLTLRTSVEMVTGATAVSDLADGEWVRLDVRDTGIGMDEATKARIFEPFFTTKEFGRGTGLGLATVYGIVRQMGGVIRVVSAPGAGATFTVFMRPTSVLSPELAEGPVAEAPGGSETILLVEDEDSVRQLLTQILQRHGYNLIVAEHPAAALVAAGNHHSRLDLVVSDVVMPGGTGPELVQTLREARPGLRALFISGYADAVFSKQGGLPRDAQFLQKPFTAIDLLIKVRQIITLPSV
jgi:PAS domain S-box-containing protein